MNTNPITQYSREELQSMLRVLKTYKQSQRQIGKRSRVFDPKNPPTPALRVEYASGITPSLVEKVAHSVIASHFTDASDLSSITYTENTHLI